MFWYLRNIFFLLLLPLLLAQDLISLNTNDVGMFDNKYFESKLRSLTPKSIFDNFKDNFKDTDTILYTDNETVISDICRRDLILLSQAVTQQELWALKMLDSSSKLPSGILLGNILDFGVFDECIESQGQVVDVEIRGRYCMYTFGVANDGHVIVKPTFSICVPASCEVEDIKSFINETINKINIPKKIQLEVEKVICSPVDKEIWSTEVIITLAVLSLFVGFIIICTLCDVIPQADDSRISDYKLLKYCRSFSLLRGLKAIFNSEVKEDTLTSIHGMRSLSMSWVILGHSMLTINSNAVVNRLYAVTAPSNWEYLYLYLAPFAVDTFFAISGLLMTYIFLKQMNKTKRFNIPMYYLHRYLRLTPAIGALLVFTIIFRPIISSGPRWEFFEGKTCRQNWWYFLLYVQNFYGLENDCLQHLWYLAVDMQLFFISPIILYPLYKKPKIGLAIIGFLLCICIIVSASIIGVNQYPLTSVTLSNQTILWEMFYYVYQKPYIRATPWLIGIVFGFDLVNKNRELSKLFVWVGWLSTIGALSFCVFGTRYFLRKNYEYNVVLETFFATVSKPLWGFGVCWIIYASKYNYTGSIKQFLSWKGFIPLSRISYSMYLVHFIFQSMDNGWARTFSYFSQYVIINYFFSTFTMTVIAATIMNLFFETPMIVLEKFLFKRNRESQHQLQHNLRSRDIEIINDKKF